MDSISVILLKYFKVLYFTNLACTTKFLKYKSFQLYGNFAHWSNMKVVQRKKISMSQVKWRKGLFTVGALNSINLNPSTTTARGLFTWLYK